MIEVKQLSKRFGTFTALNGVTCTLPVGSITGLVGSNGAGKSTLLRLMAGVYAPDSGTVSLDEQAIYPHPQAKRQLCFVADDAYFLEGANLQRMGRFYQAAFPDFDEARFQTLMGVFSLDPKKPLSAFSKGMRRQAQIVLALSCRAKVLLFDETFDGLDPVVRQTVKGLLCDEVASRNTTVLIASHSLRELEDVCDRLWLLHQGTLVIESEIAALQNSLCKVQVAFDGGVDPALFETLPLLSSQKQGALFTLVVQGEFEAVSEQLNAYSPMLLQAVPLTLEEIFALKMQAMGYTFAWEQEGSAE